MLALFLFSFLSAPQFTTTQATGCVKQPYSTYHFWLEWNGVHRMFKTDYYGPQPTLDIKLDFYSRSHFNKFWYVTSFYDCGTPGQLYMSTKAQHQFGGHMQYLFNDDTGTGVDLTDSTSAPFHSHKDGRLFLYNGAGYVEYASLGSEVSSIKYVTRDSSSNSLIFGEQEVFWLTMPYITSSMSSSTARTVNILTTHLNGIDAELEIILYRLYKGFDDDGNSLIGRAVALRAFGTQNYIALNITEDGEITLTESVTLRLDTDRHRRNPGVIHYSNVNLVYYDDVGRSQASVFLRPDIRDQNVVDERIFELLRQPDGSFRLLSTLHPDRYLATLNSGSNLVVAPLTSFSHSINYNFRLTDPGYPTDVRRLPTIPCADITPLELYNCIERSEG